MEIQNISGSDSVPRGFDVDTAHREETQTEETERVIERRPSEEPGKGQQIDTYA